jgi:hypothetical protein
MRAVAGPDENSASNDIAMSALAMTSTEKPATRLSGELVAEVRYRLNPPFEIAC